MNEKFKAFLKSIVGDIVVVSLSLIYTLTAVITMEASGKTLWQIIADGIIVFLMGFFMNRAFEHRGLEDGDAVESVRLASEKHALVVNDVIPYIDRLEDWCDMKNRTALMHGRERILAESCLKYSDFFDENGMAREFVVDEDKLRNRYLRKLEILRIRTFHKALSFKITPLTASTLLSEGGRDGDPYYLGRSKAEYAKQSSRKDAIIKIVLAVVFGYYGVRLVTDFSIANLIWKVFQVVVFLMMGTLKKDSAYSYVTVEYLGRINKKTMHLQMFAVQANIISEKNKEDNKNGINIEKQRTSRLI